MGYTRSPLRRGALPAFGTALVLFGVAACSGSGSGPDTGPQTVTLWVASPTEAFTTNLVNAYNKTHKNQVKVTGIPDDGFLQKVGTAAGARTLPDIVVSDVVYMPNYTSKGVFLDLTSRVKALPFAGSIAPSHIAAGTWNGKEYGIPHKLASSVLFYNKTLFKKAGLDPDKPPANFTELLSAAKAIRALGPDTYGFDFGGNCGGCTAYTMFPYMWAGGVDILAEQGKKANFDNNTVKQVFALYKQMWDAGVMPSNAMTQDGSTWANNFESGNVGMMAQGSAIVGALQKQDSFDWGVAHLMAPDGSGGSTFVGGDSAAISASSEHADAAWDFLQWTLQEQQQIDIVAKNGDLPVRTDLSGNQYTAKDPRTKFIMDGVATGKTPFALPFGQAFNDPTGPWIAMVRGAVFGAKPDDAVRTGQQTIQSALDSAQ
ncbi:sugar ABC transporter substrate-binding protein [Nonomuraea sp. K274]|uniref:Sugar ABC transporter substrate-binding protein n=1 Tax=Nonomuraea cypriaca TaxID=1187855 RepID=A0A931ACE5_9ACTN|nr:sugar ABC transporter substrate-binding protein [Nonomuraea cypriaca]MBF8190226.1 sugar ABC transporter substrate-binding protein [Nonomuraea cypriaca]